MNKDHEQAIQIYINLMLENTLRLVDIASPSEKVPLGSGRTASGVLVQYNRKYFVLSAGHALKTGKWVIETNKIIYPPKVVVIGIHEPQIFHNSKQDFAWVEIDFKRMADQIKIDPKWETSWVDLPFYQGPLNLEPSVESAYGFAAWKAVGFYHGINILDREARYEIYMNYLGIDESNGLHKFELARQHQGHDYYSGCSGAPISDEMGRIVSLVVGGKTGSKNGIIWGCPLVKYANEIGKV